MPIAARSSSERLLERLPVARNKPWLGHVAAVLMVAVAAAVRVLVGDALPAGYPFFTFFPAIALNAFFFGLRPGAIATLLSGLGSWYLFVTPGEFGVTAQTLTAMAFFTFVAGIELALIHFMQVANGRLARARERNAALASTSELLFRELQHRVSNNLQAAAGLLALQRQRLSDGAARDALDQASRRLNLIGRISRNLYDAGGQTSLDGFLVMLVDDLLDAYGRTDIVRHVDCRAGTRLKPDAAVSIALIVAEAIANAIEHGLDGREDAQLSIRVREQDAHLHIEVADNGAGLPAMFDPRTSDSLGLKIAVTLAERLDGRFEMATQEQAGTVARLSLPH